jgi:hypothetical protein
MVTLEQSPAARSLDVFVIKTLAAEAARRFTDGGAYFGVGLIAGEYSVGIDVHRGRTCWTASQILDDGRLHLVAHSPLPLSE